MNASLSATWLERSARILLGTIFIYAAVGKIGDPAGFAQAIANYQMLPVAWINPLALFLPWLELVCALGLIAGVCKQGCTLLVAFMLAIFAAALAYSAYRGLDIHCGCFSTDGAGTTSLWLDLARDLILLSLAVLVLYRARRPEPFPSPTDGP
ncbi:MAG: DoxX family membrane protein [Desulfatitalea sp.]|nr:DoxX family membrane protein [Desulfatitalea sp.]